MKLEDYPGGNPLKRGYKKMGVAPRNGTTILVLGGDFPADPSRQARHPVRVAWQDGAWRTHDGHVCSKPDAWRPAP